MPPLPVVPGVVKLIFSSLRGDSPVENILHIAYTGSAPDTATLASYLTGEVAPAAETLFNAEGSTDLTGVSIEALDLSSDTGASASVAFSATGVRTGDFAPSSAAVCISLEINRRYRGGHPRNYWPFGTAGTYESGSSKLWDTGFIAAVQGAFTTFADAIQAVTVGGTSFTTLVNVSYYDRNLNPVAPYRRTTPVVDNVVGYVTKQRICSQRRRLGKILG